MSKTSYPVRASLNYIGSKYTLLPFITQNIKRVVGDTAQKTLAEVFAGTGAVAKYFKPRVKQVIANDMEPYSYALLRNYIGNHLALDCASFLAALNQLPGIDGLIFQHYCLGGGQKRQYFSDENGRKIDAIRQQLEIWRQSQVINEDQFYFLLATLLESADRVANVASVYGAYLKHLKRTAQRPLNLEPATIEPTPQPHQVYQEDANNLLRQIEGDILYLDPPYNHRQYGANYHLLNTIALYDDFTPKGKTGLRDYVRSPYCQRDKVATAFEDLIAQANFRYIFLSYNNEGLMSVEQVETIMSKYGRYTLETQDYQRFKADRDSNRQHKASRTQEYLHILVKAK